MMILKTSLLNLLFLLIGAPQAFAFNEFDCLRDMLPVTAHGSFQSRRKGFEQPFMVDDSHMVFPEVQKKVVTGFYLYTRDGGWYYDAVQAGDKPPEPISALNQKGKVLYQMVVQPAGLETVTLYYMPGFDARETNSEGPVMLGASVLPVVGAFVSRPEKTDFVYQNPTSVSEDELKSWVYRNMGGRKPAAASKIALSRSIVKLATKVPKSEAALYAPMKSELELREKWTEDRNLDDQTFRSLSRVMQTTCKR
jgi:hypothetical protein